MALFIDNVLIDQVQEDKRHTSKLFVRLLDQLLKRNNINLADVDFCAVNCGPGPFSTLRSIIASVNGLHAAINVPLIGIDGLEATFLEFYDQQYEHTVVLLNAFNHEVYYLFAHKGQIVAKGYQKIDVLLDETQQQTKGFIHLFGNGATLYHDLIRQTLGQNAIITFDNPAMCSLEMIGALGIEKWRQNRIDTYLMPLHLKKHAVER